MKPTMKDIAQDAGVSTASVSLVLNNKPSRIPEVTRQRIMDSASKLGYRSFDAAEYVSPQKGSGIIGVILPESDDFSQHEYLLGIENYATIYHYKIIICPLASNTKAAITCIHFLRELGIDGIIMVPPDDMNKDENNQRLGEALQAIRRPFVLLSRAIDRVFTDFVTSDFKAGAYLAVEHLILNGHCRIGVLSDAPEIYNTRKKLEGFEEALMFYGYSLRKEDIYQGNGSISCGYEGAKYFDKCGIDSILSMDEQSAFGVYQYARDNSIRIGEDLSLVSFGNSPVCGILSPALTTVNEEYIQMGKKACERLILRMEGKDKDGPKNSYFVPILTERHSVSKTAPVQE